jgi:hypothetical protein
MVSGDDMDTRGYRHYPVRQGTGCRRYDVLVTTDGALDDASYRDSLPEGPREQIPSGTSDSGLTGIDRAPRCAGQRAGLSRLANNRSECPKSELIVYPISAHSQSKQQHGKYCYAGDRDAPPLTGSDVWTWWS